MSNLLLSGTGFVTPSPAFQQGVEASRTLKDGLNNPSRPAGFSGSHALRGNHKHRVAVHCRGAASQHSHAARGNEETGFTLLEVLIALAVLAVLMMGLLKISAANAQNLWYLENKTLAATIAANHAAELRLQDEQQESADGWDDMAGRRWHWQADRLAMQPMNGVQRYRIDVSLQDDPSPYASLVVDLAEKS